MIRRVLLILLVGLAAPAAAQVDTLWVTPTVSPSMVKLGEPFSITLRLERTPGDSLEGPQAPVAFGPLDLRSSQDRSTPDSLVWVLEGALFTLGDVQLPGIPFVLKRDSGPLLMVSRPYLLTVEATAPDTAQALKDIRPPLPSPLRWEWFMLLGTLMALALAAWLIWFWRKNRLDPEPWVLKTPLDPPHIEAKKALTELEQEALPSRGMIKEHYYRLSGIFRSDMERRFGFPAAEETTFEIEPHLSQISLLSDQDRQQAIELLDRADLAKFAKMNPGSDAALQDLESVRDWVSHTEDSTDHGEESV